MKPVKKIVIIGGESTGKSTLCEQLANQYNTVWVPEYARQYLEHLDREYEQRDLTEIAIGQLAMEEVMAEEAKGYLFCDTDLHVIRVWSEYKYSSCNQFILDAIASQQYDAYIITSPDFPWQEDPLREHPEPALRAHFFNLYKEIVANTKLPNCIVEGNEKARIETALNFISKVIELREPR